MGTPVGLYSDGHVQAILPVTPLHGSYDLSLQLLRYLWDPSEPTAPETK